LRVVEGRAEVAPSFLRNNKVDYRVIGTIRWQGASPITTVVNIVKLGCCQWYRSGG
jgi:hypothetical protein